MKRVLYSLLLVLPCLLLACSKKKDEIDHGRLAGQAAKHYYEQLLKGKYDAFLSGENRVEKLPDSYRKQLLINFRQFVEQQKEDHKGVDSVSLTSSVFSAKDSTASPFLLFHYGDKTTEQFVVPMVKVHGKWLMR